MPFKGAREATPPWGVGLPHPSVMQIKVTFLSGGVGDTHLVSSYTHQYLGWCTQVQPTIMGCSHTEVETWNLLFGQPQWFLIWYRKGVSVSAHNKVSDQLLNLHYHFKLKRSRKNNDFLSITIQKAACNIVIRRILLWQNLISELEIGYIVVTWWLIIVLQYHQAIARLYAL